MDECGNFFSTSEWGKFKKRDPKLSTASWLIALCASYCSFKVDRNFNLIFNEKTRSLKYFRPWIFTMRRWIMQQSVNYSSWWLAVLRPCFKKHAKWEWVGRAVSTHFTQSCLQEKLSPSMSISYFFCALKELHPLRNDPRNPRKSLHH